MKKLTKINLILKALGFFKIPMIFYVRPKVTQVNETSMELVVPFRRRTKNHLNSMYLGALSVGADLAGGLYAQYLIQESKQPISLVFKSMQAQFLKRVEGNAHFVCNDGPKIQKLIDEVIATPGERKEQSFDVLVYVPSKLGEELAAKFTMELSLKSKHKKS